MVKNRFQNKTNPASRQAAATWSGKSRSAAIGTRTPVNFEARHLTPYGGLLPVSMLLEKLGFAELVGQYVSSTRITRALSLYQFVMAMVLGLYLGFARFHQLQFVATDPLLNGILQVQQLPPQSTFWRFLAGLHGSVALRLVQLQQCLRGRVWSAARISLQRLTLDTDTTVHTLYGRQMGGRVSYSPKKKGVRSHQPILTFLAETREYVAGQLRNGDRPTARQIQRHLQQIFRDVPESVRQVRARADSGFYCWATIETYETHHCQFIVVARKTARLLAALTSACWRPSPHPEAEAECEFLYQPEGWGRPYRFVALRFPQKKSDLAAEQYQLFASGACRYRVFVTNMQGSIHHLVAFYNGRCTAENLIKEANHEAGAATHPFHRFDMNQIHFQLAMLAYNLNCWLALFEHPPEVPLSARRHTTLATMRLRWLFVAARLWHHAGRVGLSYSSSYPDRALLMGLIARLRHLHMRFPPGPLPWPRAPVAAVSCRA